MARAWCMESFALGGASAGLAGPFAGALAAVAGAAFGASLVAATAPPTSPSAATAARRVLDVRMTGLPYSGGGAKSPRLAEVRHAFPELYKESIIAGRE